MYGAYWLKSLTEPLKCSYIFPVVWLRLILTGRSGYVERSKVRILGHVIRGHTGWCVGSHGFLISEFRNCKVDHFSTALMRSLDSRNDPIYLQLIRIINMFSFYHLACTCQCLSLVVVWSNNSCFLYTTILITLIMHTNQRIPNTQKLFCRV